MTQKNVTMFSDIFELIVEFTSNIFAWMLLTLLIVFASGVIFFIAWCWCIPLMFFGKAIKQAKKLDKQDTENALVEVNEPV